MSISPAAVPEPVWERLVETAPGVFICCRCYGTGEQTVVLLHGNGEDYRCFARQYASFSEKYRLLAIDSRGHGRSSYVSPLSFDAMADDLEHVLHALSVDRAMVVGFSDGGNTALLFALRHPKRVERLVVIGANLFPAGLLARERRKNYLAWWLIRFYRRFSLKAKKRADLLELMVFQPQLSPAHLAKITAPTLVIAGANDVILEEHTQLIARSLPNAHLRIIPACGHYVLRDQAPWANETILRFLAQNS